MGRLYGEVLRRGRCLFITILRAVAASYVLDSECERGRNGGCDTYLGGPFFYSFLTFRKVPSTKSLKRTGLFFWGFVPGISL